jgi:non-specific serine/threonine protein kinase
MLEVSLIGKFEVKYDDKPVTVSSRAAQSLFAYLILNAGTAHRREKLAGVIWPDIAEEKARAYLRHELWRIRKALPSKSKVDYLFADDMNISFNSSAKHWLDVTTLKNLGEAASIEELIAALSTYQGELLPGFYEDWIVLEREHLQALYEQKMARLLELLQSETRWPEILDWAERWISFGQSPEAAYRYLMIAYDALGDRAKVASTYGRCMQALRELDLEPSEQTRAVAFERASKLNIPIPLTSFIGRERELKEVADLLSKSRLVTLTGAGGVGKTRLAIQIVAEILDMFPDGVWFLDLAPLSDPALVPITLASLLGLHETTDTKSSVIDLLISSFRPRIALVIFDNCEHLVAACAQLVNLLLTSCQDLSVLATSREALRVSGEIPYRVPSLTIPKPDIEFTIDEFSNTDSVKLFAERAAVTSPGFAISPQNALAIAQICQRLDGIPLAIELAAARINVLTVQQILKRLDDRFNLLTDGMRTALPRQQTLRATIEWSYSLLPEKERILFRRLAVFTGGWTLDAAERVCSGEGIQSSDVLNLLSQLVNKSLVVVETGELETRYRRLEIIREFAREKLIEATEAGRLQDRHLAYFLTKAEEIEPGLVGADPSAFLDYLDRELDNIRLALEWSIATRKGYEALRLFGALGSFWFVRCHFLEGAEWFRRALPLQEKASKSAQAKALRHAGSLYFAQENFSASRSALRESLDIYRQLDDVQEISTGLQYLGVLEVGQRDFAQARTILEESLSIGRVVNNKPTMIRALINLAYMSQVEGDYVIAARRYEEGLEICRNIQDTHLTSLVLQAMGDFVFAQKNNTKAREYYEEALSICLKLKNKRTVAYALLGIANLLYAEARNTQSAQLQGFAVTLLNQLGFITELDLGDINKAAENLKTSMGDDLYRTEFEIGNMLSLEQAVNIALK